MKNWLLTPPSFEDLVRLLRAWRFWLLGALIGGLLGTVIYFIFPPEYRASATVVVSFNMEKTWPNNPDNQLFYYLDRETRKVEAVAWSDATLDQVAKQVGNVTAAELASGKLQLSQPEDGGWHFYADDPDPERAKNLASTWAQVFTTQIQQGIQIEVELDATRKALVVTPGDPTIQAQISALEAKSLAITPELQVSLSQSKDLSPQRKIGLGTYVIAGALVFLAVAALVILFLGERIA